MNLKMLRKSQKMTQQQFADSLGLERVTYVRYENGARSVPNEILLKVAETYDVSVDYLLGRDEHAKTEQPTVKDDELREEVIELLNGLDPADFQRMKDFAAGLKSSREK